ncbi:hypothetical protein MLD38_031688 [Melastoma candidum]|uniref:Uncharacterized protein n=1 Tax=Melastoma candidum TaxID=119954 RepID=A0ACB9MRN6_9MYRT|nr:hypothetical protein MLD38_031688 [Melastoma candidum]
MSAPEVDPPPVPDIDLRRIRVFDAVGRGAKGVVFLAREVELGEFWALKVILRDNIEKNKNKKKKKKNRGEARTEGEDQDGAEDEYRRVWFEQEVLRQFDHPLLPKLRAVLSTELVVGYAIDYCPGRDLNALRRKQTEKMFSDDMIRFYAAELVLVLEYLHNLGIVYRDLKPENVMIQENGHIMLVDFDLSTRLPPKSARSSPTIGPQPTQPIKPQPSPRRRPQSRRVLLPCLSPPWEKSSSAVRSSPNSVFPAESSSNPGSAEKSNSFVGTEEYVAPEVILGEGHDFSVDWWSLGVLLHEMLYGETPFRGSNRKETFYRILTRRAELVGETTPLRDLIGRLLEKDPRRRIGAEGIKGHDFFLGMDWGAVTGIQRPPFVPHFEGERWEHGKEVAVVVDVEGFVQRIFAAKNNDDDDDDDDAINNNNKDEFLVF